MRSIKVLATDSTNVFLRELYRDKPSLENSYVVTDKQTAGRGQMGSKWTTQPGKNLTCSILLNDLNLPLKDQFKISALTAIGIIKALQQLNIQKLTIKWPNDILADKQKVCGILIENILKGRTIKATIVGIGLNINQTHFEDLNQASSLKLQTGINYNLNEVTELIVNMVEDEVLSNLSLSLSEILTNYKNHLFRLNKPSTFEFPDNSTSPGIIKDITHEGKLKVLFEDEITKLFEIKEIKLLY